MKQVPVGVKVGVKSKGFERNPFGAFAYLNLGRDTPGVTRTPDTRFRKPLLCPPELRGRESELPGYLKPLQ